MSTLVSLGVTPMTYLTDLFLATRSQVLMLCLIILTLTVDLSLAARSQVLLVSMDGFRHDYLAKTRTPNFDAMRRAGVTMAYMNNTFATSTFPNHYTMVTGLYTESHGILANAMYDPKFDAHFTKKSKETRWWDDGEPIWITAVKQGKKAGVFFWPGSESELQGSRPTEWRAYNKSTPYSERINTTMGWLEEGFDLALLYFSEPDTTGHVIGPDSADLLPVIERMDAVLGDIRQQLDHRGLKDSVNLIVTSDHGMTSISTERLVVLSELVNSSLLLEAVTSGAFSHLRPQPGRALQLRDAIGRAGFVTSWVKADVPERFHAKRHRRMTEVFVLADEGWSIVPHPIPADFRRHGGHGYDNYRPNMKPFFQAVGPAFKTGVKVAPISNLDLYPLICRLLDLAPAPNNGSVERAATLLAEGGGSVGGSVDVRPAAGLMTSLTVGVSLAQVWLRC